MNDVAEREPLLLAVVKAAVVSAISALPVFLYLYLEEPRFRWAVDAWWAERRHSLALAEWRRWWAHLPGWQQEAWNTFHPLPADLVEPAPPDLFLSKLDGLDPNGKDSVKTPGD